MSSALVAKFTPFAATRVPPRNHSKSGKCVQQICSDQKTARFSRSVRVKSPSCTERLRGVATRTPLSRDAFSCVMAATAPPTQLTLHMGETSMSFVLPVEAAQQLNKEMEDVFAVFKAKAEAPQRGRLSMMEFVYKSGSSAVVPGLALEVICNPNAYPNAFQAKVLVTLVGAGVKVTSEGLLTDLKSDVDQYLAMV